MAAAPRTAPSLRIDRERGEQARTKAKVHPLLSSSSSRFLALGSGCRRDVEGWRGESKWPGEPHESLFSRFYSPPLADSPRRPQIYCNKCERFCSHRQLGPTLAKTPMGTHNNNRSAVIDVGGGTVALSHRPAAAHASPPTRDDCLKSRTRTACTGPCRPQPAEDPLARDRQLCAICKP